MAVLIDNRQKAHKLTLKRIRRTAQDILDALDCPDGELSIVLVDDPQITVLNRQYLQRNRPTNVIAFPMRSGEFSDLTPQLLGDVVISLETADREAREAGITLDERFRQLLVHGVLHLLGYDHENDASAARRMEEKSAALLARTASIDRD